MKHIQEKEDRLPTIVKGKLRTASQLLCNGSSTQSRPGHNHGRSGLMQMLLYCRASKLEIVHTLANLLPLE